MAKTKFWICGDCGFKNHPHAFRLGKSNEKCEQCGSPVLDIEGQEKPDHLDYNPASSS
jgi:hypothetical protein